MCLLVLDVSCNELELFPASLSGLKLQEFYFENNPLLPHIPVHAIQEEEVFQLSVCLYNKMADKMDATTNLDHFYFTPIYKLQFINM